MFEGILENIIEKKPLVHSITNNVTINDCANIILACGASPIMA
ncbi:MAG: hydroxyethylthiazole kinase, partial [Cellulosilyticaceae bacterium]